MMKLNTTSEWDTLVNDNHRRVADAEFQQELAQLAELSKQNTGADREAIAMKMEANRPGKLAKVAMAACCVVIIMGGIVSVKLTGALGVVAVAAGITVSQILKGRHR